MKNRLFLIAVLTAPLWIMAFLAIRYWMQKGDSSFRKSEFESTILSATNHPDAFE